MGIIGWIVLGLLAGAIAKALLPGDDPGGIFIAGVLFDSDPVDEFFDLSTWIAAIVGSIILLLIYRMVTGRRRT
jgi:uncharacterized membrane protein YeaQ/YmgE (transglycosylase-associated protein family)